MKIRTLGRHLRQGFLNIGRNGWMSFASVSSVAITLFILGVFMVLAMNVNHIASTVENQVKIRVVLKQNIEKTEIASIEGKLKAIPEIEEVTFVSKEQGLQNFKKSFGDKAYWFEGLENENPLSDIFDVKARNPKETEAVAEQIRKMQFVEYVNYGKETVDKLFRVTTMIRNAGVVFIIGLAFTAMFLIANTIKITIFGRRREIEIMRLVGATNAFIRWPFFIEGLLMGVCGALLPIVLLLFSYRSMYNYVKVDLALYFVDLLPVDDLAYQVGVLLLSIGAFIGVWGSMVSVHRFLKI